MPHVQVKLYATFRAYSNGAASVEVPIDSGQTVRDVLDRLGVPADQVRILFVDNRAGELGQSLQGGEKLGLFPAIGGG